MDVTPLFKACVKTVRTRNKAFGVHSDADKNRILKTKPKGGFVSRAKEVTSQITKLRDFLLEHRSAYLNFSTFVGSGSGRMSDVERDQIDSGSQKIINTCSHIVHDFKRESGKVKVSSAQTKEFRDAVVRTVEDYLKTVCAIQAEQKTLRTKRASEIRKLSRLETDSKSPEPSENRAPSTERRDDDRSSEGVTKATAAEIDNSITSEDDRLSSEELQMFESENLQLYGELNSLSEEVKQIERKVLDIAELQEVFTEKVLQQDQDVDRISGTVIGVNENVRDANEQIKQAIQRNAGLRVWVLFFLLVMSFSLLFLDWYND